MVLIALSRCQYPSTSTPPWLLICLTAVHPVCVDMDANANCAKSPPSYWFDQQINRRVTSCHPGACSNHLNDNVPQLLQKHPSVRTVVVHLGGCAGVPHVDNFTTFLHRLNLLKCSFKPQRVLSVNINLTVSCPVHNTHCLTVYTIHPLPNLSLCGHYNRSS